MIEIAQINPADLDDIRRIAESLQRRLQLITDSLWMMDRVDESRIEPLIKMVDADAALDFSSVAADLVEQLIEVFGGETSERHVPDLDSSEPLKEETPSTSSAWYDDLAGQLAQFAGIHGVSGFRVNDVTGGLCIYSHGRDALVFKSLASGLFDREIDEIPF